jgi:N-terminal acetyltransferase B complex non-catalytic subunit
LEFLSVLDATLPRQVSSSHSVQSRQDVEAKITNSKALFSKIAEEDGLKDRSGFLALLELERRSVAHGLSKGGYDPTFSGVLFVDRVRQIQVGWAH